MHNRAVSASSTVPAPIRISGRCSASFPITWIAPGTVIVISSTVTPPAAIASANARALSTDSARNTGTSPISFNAFNTAIFSIISPNHKSLIANHCFLPLHPRSAALHDALHLIKSGHRRIARRSHGQRTVSAAAVHCPVRTLVVQEAVDQPRGKPGAATDAIEDLLIRHRPSLIERTLVVADRAPVVDARRLRMPPPCSHP